MSFIEEIALPLLRDLRDVRLALLGLLVVAIGEENLDSAIDRLDEAAATDLKGLPKRQRALGERINGLARAAAHDLRQIKEKL